MALGAGGIRLRIQRPTGSDNPASRDAEASFFIYGRCRIPGPVHPAGMISVAREELCCSHHSIPTPSPTPSQPTASFPRTRESSSSPQAQRIPASRSPSGASPKMDSRVRGNDAGEGARGRRSGRRRLGGRVTPGHNATSAEGSAYLAVVAAAPMPAGAPLVQVTLAPLRGTTESDILPEPCWISRECAR